MTAIAKSPKRTIAKPQLHLRRAEWFATSVRLPQMNAEVFTGLNFTWTYSRHTGKVDRGRKLPFFPGSTFPYRRFTRHVTF